jgi:leucyl aminopeptidase
MIKEPVMLKITTTTHLEHQQCAIILTQDVWQHAKATWPELNHLRQEDWPDSGKTRFLNHGAGKAFFLLNLDWTKHTASKTFKAVIKEIDAHKFEKALYVGHDDRPLLRKIVWQGIDALYTYDRFMSKKREFSLKELCFFDSKKSDTFEKEIALGRNMAQAITTTKTLAETPSNHCTPAYMAQRAQEIASQSPYISSEILGYEAIKKLGMNSFLSVAQGSAHEPRFIIMSYTPPSSRDQEAPIVFVGKGITFDTGGHSLKPASSMMGMKFDMSGGATVLGLFEFLAHHPLDKKIIGLIPCCENIPGGLANKPDDVVVSMSGQSIEILNTDAEGRLILCDALTYAERFNPKYVIDIATLTGSCLATFGSVASGLMGNNAALVAELKEAAERSGDKVWELPLWEDWHDDIKSPVADMANIGSNHAGAIIAGVFLQKFAGAFSWAHLDVAGTACDFHGHKRGATGRPLPLLIDFLLGL